MNARLSRPLTTLARAPITAAVTFVLALTFTACSRQESLREIDWAKSALARNPDFEILATDESVGVFTVRETTTGLTRTLKMSELIAAPAPSRETPRPAPAAPTAPAPPPEAPDPALAAVEQTTETVTAVASGPGEALASGPGYSITRAQVEETPVPAGTLEGPGYRIEKPTAPTATTPPRSASAGGEKRSDPIICQGDRLMRIDGESFDFAGDAVIAEKGCDLYLSNVRINAGGVGIIARQARVRIVNSIIGGTRGSYEVSQGAEIYAAHTAFTGVGRRFEGGTLTDLGGNSYSTY